MEIAKAIHLKQSPETKLTSIDTEIQKIKPLVCANRNVKVKEIKMFFNHCIGTFKFLFVHKIFIQFIFCIYLGRACGKFRSHGG